MHSYRIPFNRPGLRGGEFRYIRDAVAQGHLAGDGGYSRRCQRILEWELGAARVMLTPSCTHALEMAALLLDMRQGVVRLPFYDLTEAEQAEVVGAVRSLGKSCRDGRGRAELEAEQGEEKEGTGEKEVASWGARRGEA